MTDLAANRKVLSAEGAQRRKVLSSEDQDWMTPPLVFAWLNAYFGFTLDAAASDAAHVCPVYYTPATNGLAHDWLQPDGTPHVVFCNPPYGMAHGKSLQAPWFFMAHEQARAHNVVSALLVPPRTDRWWWHHYAVHAREIWLLTPRIEFLDAATGKPRPGGNTTPSCLVVFGPGLHKQPVLRFKTING